MKSQRAFRLLGLVAISFCGWACAVEPDPSDTEAPTTTTQTRALTVAPPAESVSLPAVRDTAIQLTKPNQNFGKDKTLGVHRALIGFDAAAIRGAMGAQGFLVSARLEVTLSANSLKRLAPARALTVYKMLRPWTETGATWNCAEDARPKNAVADCTGANRWSMLLPPTPFAATASATATLVPQQSGVIGFDVTADVRSGLTTASADAAWLIRTDLLGELLEVAAFSAREGTAGPRLVLTVQRCSAALCDDGDVCSSDTCSLTGQCVHAPAVDGTACSDGDACTGTDQCRAGVCQAGTENLCAPPPIVINEVESSGGTPGDFVELYNAGTTEADLSGWVFKDNDDTHAYTVPAGTRLAAGAFLILEEAALTFGLGSADSARLFDAHATLVDSYIWTTHAATTYGRCPSGSGPLVLTASSTKNSANTCGGGPVSDAGAGPDGFSTTPDAGPDGGAAATTVTINEIESNMGAPGDWVELYNRGATSVNLAGWSIKDNDDTHVVVLAAGTNIAPGAYLVVEEATLGYGLGAADAVRLYRPDGTLADTHAWTVHAATTYARCPDGVGPFALASASTKAGPNTCGGGSVDAGVPDAGGADGGGFPGTPWPGSSTVVTGDRAGAFGSNLSGLTYQPASDGVPAILWAAQNSPSKIHRLELDGSTWVNSTAPGWATGKLLAYPGNTGAPDSEGLTKTDFASPFIYVATERDNLNNGVSRLSLLRYDSSSTDATLVATHEWNLTANLPAVGPNLGIEAVTWVPNDALVAKGFFDESRNAAYDPTVYPNHGGGIFFVGIEATGMIYGYALDHGTGGFVRVATFSSGQSGVMGLEFDRDNGVLWAHCDNTCGNRSTLFTIAPDAPNQGRFVLSATLAPPLDLPITLNNEGIAMVPMSECQAGLRRFFWSDDGATDGHSLRIGGLACAPIP